jgi:hypothetical protein
MSDIPSFVSSFLGITRGAFARIGFTCLGVGNLHLRTTIFACILGASFFWILDGILMAEKDEQDVDWVCGQRDICRATTFPQEDSRLEERSQVEADFGLRLVCSLGRIMSRCEGSSILHIYGTVHGAG